MTVAVTAKVSIGWFYSSFPQPDPRTNSRSGNLVTNLLAIHLAPGHLSHQRCEQSLGGLNAAPHLPAPLLRSVTLFTEQPCGGA